MAAVSVALDCGTGFEGSYLVPPQLQGCVGVGSMVKVPLGSRAVLGVVTALETRTEGPLKAVLSVVGDQPVIGPRLLELVKWVSRYYCCSIASTLKAALPGAVRGEKDGWKKQLRVAIVHPVGSQPNELTDRQRQVVGALEEWRDLLLTDLVRLTGTTAATIRRLERLGLARIYEARQERQPAYDGDALPSKPKTLTSEQQLAFAEISAVIAARSEDQVRAADAAARTFLLHGITGSGKTEIYLQALAVALEKGLGAIVLVPEISLTPQTVERFRARFDSAAKEGGVAVLHSQLSAGQRHDEWQKIAEGRARIVIGARSAVFAPVVNLGLIIVDEEHEQSYKQEETPRYHARDVAVMRGRIEGAVVVLGSATPSVESYANALSGKYRLLKLTQRATEMHLPVVRIVDLRHEKPATKAQALPFLSRRLREGIQDRLDRREQVILFLNRRGYSTALLCERCGHAVECPHCSLALTYHRSQQTLLCHLCGYRQSAPLKCPVPECGNPAIRYSGVGTQRLEEALHDCFPKARIQRMDTDALKQKDDCQRILAEFRVGKTDILMGTQMIAKGLDFPNVTLVGIVYADQSLHLPDFRATERTFQLLTQVSGRAGRGDVEGEVIVQTFTPFHPSIQFARHHDFEGFYEQEAEFRRQLQYPPFVRLALLTLKARSEDKVRFCADYLRKQLETEELRATVTSVSGPAPAPLLRLGGFFRYQLLLRTRTMSRLAPLLAELQGNQKLPHGVKLTVNVDPVSFL